MRKAHADGRERLMVSSSWARRPLTVALGRGRPYCPAVGHWCSPAEPAKVETCGAVPSATAPRLGTLSAWVTLHGVGVGDPPSTPLPFRLGRSPAHSISCVR